MRDEQQLAKAEGGALRGGPAARLRAATVGDADIGRDDPPRSLISEVKEALGAIWGLRLIRVAWRRFAEDNSFALSGYLAYTALLSFFPFMIFLVVTGSFVVGRDESIVLVNQMFALTPPQVASTLQPIFEGIIATKTGFLAVISAAVGLWAGSNAFEAARIGFNLAYDVREDRHFVRRRVQSLSLAAAAAIVFICLSFLIVLWPLIGNLVASEGQTSIQFEAFYLLRYAIGLPMFCMLLVVLHLTLPKGQREGYRLHVNTEHGEHWLISVLPGVLASALIWFVAATAFSLYLRYAPSFAGNYGAMAGVVITLLFFYMSSIVIFFGAQLNIAREELARDKSVRDGQGEAAQEAADISVGELARLRRILRHQG